MTAPQPPPAFLVPAHPDPPRPVVPGDHRPNRIDGPAPPSRTSPLRYELLSELALVALSMSAVFSLSRLFDDGSFLAPLLLMTVVGHGATALLRHRRATAPVVAVVAAGGGAVLLASVLYPATTYFALPTADTLSTARADLSEAWDLFGRVAAPAPVEVGFVLASALALWVVVWFSDWAAFRLDAVIEATVPAGAVFVFGAMLGAPRHRTLSTLVFLGALLAFLLSHRVGRQARQSTWVGDGAVPGARANLGRGMAVVLITVLAAGVVGPRLPGTGAPPLLDWRGRGDGPGTRVTVSPLVDIRKRLVDQSDVELFQVRSNERAYWRMTGLDIFDGTVWSSSGSFAEADGELPADEPAPAVATLTQDYDILNLAAIWLPAAFNPADVSAETGVRWDEESSTLIVDANSDSSDDISYSVVSSVPRFDKDDLDRNDGAVPLPIISRYTKLSPDFPANVADLAGSIARPGRNPYQKARLLQDWFRKEFTYDLAATDAGHSDSAIESFLESRRGYCEQFAGTFAAMARSLGLPARVAVGFTPERSTPTRWTDSSSRASMPTPGPRSSSTRPAGWPSSPRPAGAPPGPRTTRAWSRTRRTAKVGRPQPPRRRARPAAPRSPRVRRWSPRPRNGSTPPVRPASGTPVGADPRAPPRWSGLSSWSGWRRGPGWAGWPWLMCSVAPGGAGAPAPRPTTCTCPGGRAPRPPPPSARSCDRGRPTASTWVGPGSTSEKRRSPSVAWPTWPRS
ncbi:MAG: DUF3488 and transglutaminase-like domain-containing protein [Acidimicrobiales bacterium]